VSAAVREDRQPAEPSRLVNGKSQGSLRKNEKQLCRIRQSSCLKADEVSRYAEDIRDAAGDSAEHEIADSEKPELEVLGLKHLVLALDEADQDHDYGSAERYYVCENDVIHIRFLSKNKNVTNGLLHW